MSTIREVEEQALIVSLANRATLAVAAESPLRSEGLTALCLAFVHACVANEVPLGTVLQMVDATYASASREQAQGAAVTS